MAEFDNELGLNEGDMVYLIRYVDNEWLEAELDASRRYEIIFIIHSIILYTFDSGLRQGHLEK